MSKNPYEIEGPYRSRSYIIGHLVAGAFMAVLLIVLPIAIAKGWL